VVAAVIVVAATAAAVFGLRSSPRLADVSSRAVLRAEARSRAAAVAWIKQQVSPTAVVACDPQTCTALRTAGFPSANLRALAGSSAYPTTSTLVVETAAVRQLFGSSLGTQAAPDILTSFGTGQALVAVRVIAPKGATAYEQAMAADLTTRKQTGAALLRIGAQIRAEPGARQELAGGEVDTRLLFLITDLAGAEPIDIISFGNSASNPSPDLPLRSAVLAARDATAHRSQAAYLALLRKTLQSVPADYRPLSETMVTVLGRRALQIEMGAPSPLGLFGPGGR
jgi:hypothetical protein